MAMLSTQSRVSILEKIAESLMWKEANLIFNLGISMLRVEKNSPREQDIIVLGTLVTALNVKAWKESQENIIYYDKIKEYGGKIFEKDEDFLYKLEKLKEKFPVFSSYFDNIDFEINALDRAIQIQKSFQFPQISRPTENELKFAKAFIEIRDEVVRFYKKEC